MDCLGFQSLKGIFEGIFRREAYGNKHRLIRFNPSKGFKVPALCKHGASH